MKAVVDQENCIGCELCVQICPDVFSMEENLAQVIVDVVAADVEDDCRAAAEGCPVDAISISE
jgi:ferredoxin